MSHYLTYLDESSCQLVTVEYQRLHWGPVVSCYIAMDGTAHPLPASTQFGRKFDTPKQVRMPMRRKEKKIAELRDEIARAIPDLRRSYIVMLGKPVERIVLNTCTRSPTGDCVVLSSNTSCEFCHGHPPT